MNFKKNNLILFTNEKKINFNLFFVSLISPFVVNNLRFSFTNSLKEKKVFLKQSYILLTWFYYLSFVNQNINNKNKLKFSILPSYRKKFTLTKAPMAHKNWSKEQYKFEYYKFKISFNFFLKSDNNINSVNNAILFFLLTKKNFPQFETNIFFLKNIKIFFFFNDNKFFNYHLFLLN